jgi:hypothetical protein
VARQTSSGVARLRIFFYNSGHSVNQNKIICSSAQIKELSFFRLRTNHLEVHVSVRFFFPGQGREEHYLIGVGYEMVSQLLRTFKHCFYCNIE